MSTATSDQDDDLTATLHAFVDNELDPAASLALQRRLEREPALAARCAHIRALRVLLRDAVPPENASDALRDKLLAASRPARRPREDWRGMAIAASLAGVIASGATWLAMVDTRGDPVLQSIVSGHARGLASSRPVDVESSDRHTVKPWFAGRLPFAPLLTDSVPEGYTFLGGRVDIVGGQPAATLVYRRAQHVISLTQTRRDLQGQRLAGDGTIQRDGFAIYKWHTQDLSFWVISDQSPEDVTAFVGAWRKVAETS